VCVVSGNQIQLGTMTARWSEPEYDAGGRCAVWPLVPCALIYGRIYLPIIIYTPIYYNMNLIYTSIKSGSQVPGEA
jgi:hypothetical protein